MYAVLIFYPRSEIFKLCHVFRAFISHSLIMILSCSMVTRHNLFLLILLIIIPYAFFRHRILFLLMDPLDI